MTPTITAATLDFTSVTVDAVEGHGCVEPAEPFREENGGGVLFAVSFPAMEAVLAGGAVVRVERARVVQDVDRPAEKLGLEACRSCTSCSAIQARWNKRVIV